MAPAQTFRGFREPHTLKVSKRKITEPRFFSCYALLGIQKSFIEHGKEELSTDFERVLGADPLLHRSAGPEVVDQLARWEPVLQYIEHKNTFIKDPTRHLRLPSLPQSLGSDNGLWEEAEQEDFARSYGYTKDFVAAVQD
jgi:hypothetical protein